MKKTLFLFCALLGMVSSNPSFASTIFDDIPSSNPTQQPICSGTWTGTYNGETYSGSSGGAPAWLASKFQATDTNRNPRAKGVEDMRQEPENYLCRGYAAMQYDRYQTADHEEPISTPTVRMTITAAVETVEDCPAQNDSFTSRSFGTQATGSLKCYSPMDVAQNDTCPTSFGEDRSILPAGDNPTAKMCQQKDDGSKCLYSYDSANNVYLSDLENLPDCYLDARPPSHNGDLPIQDPQNPSCFDMGNGVTACEANPQEMCTNGICETGCGTVNDVFVCLGETPIDEPIDEPYEPPQPPEVDCSQFPHYSQCQTENPEPLDCSNPANASHPSCGGDVSGYCFQNPNDSACSPTFGGGGVPVQIDMTETNSLLTQIRGELQRQPEHKTSGELESGIETITNETIDKMNETLEQTPEEAGAKFLEESDTQFISSAFGSIPVGQCQNPVLYQSYTLDICHRVPEINSFLYWIVAALTVLFVYGELNTAFRVIN